MGVRRPNLQALFARNYKRHRSHIKTRTQYIWEPLQRNRVRATPKSVGRSVGRSVGQAVESCVVDQCFPRVIPHMAGAQILIF